MLVTVSGSSPSKSGSLHEKKLKQRNNKHKVEWPQTKSQQEGDAH